MPSLTLRRSGLALLAGGLLLSACSAPTSSTGTEPGAGSVGSTRTSPTTAPSTETASTDAPSRSTSTPVTQPSSTEPPTTEPPTSQPPTDPPSTDPPTTEQPTPAAPPAAPDVPVPPGGLVTAQDMADAAARVDAMDVPARAGAVIMASSADAVGTDLVSTLGLGGVILMGSRGIVDGTDSGTPAQVAAVTAALQDQSPDLPILIATDQEYGDVQRLVNGFTDFPGASELAAIDDTDRAVALTEQSAAAAAAEMLAVGITLDFAPDADIVPDPSASAIGDRSYGADPERVAALVVAAVRGYQSAGVAATVKHFPGIGAIAADTHEELPTVTTSCAEWNTDAAVPFRRAVDAGVALVMTGHVLQPAIGVDQLPTSLSREALTDLLRGPGAGGCEPLGFQGIAVSDALEMAPVADAYSSGEAGWRALAAGQDLLLMPVDPAAAHAGIVTAVSDGSLDPDRLREAAVRVTALRLATARSPQPDLAVVGSAAHEALAEEARSAG